MESDFFNLLNILEIPYRIFTPKTYPIPQGENAFRDSLAGKVYSPARLSGCLSSSMTSL